VLEKVHEEIGELEDEMKRSSLSRDELELELGDCLFTLANLARHLKLDAESALRRGCLKFHDRFTRLEASKQDEGRSIADCQPEELEAGWERIKQER
jgi:uncharacterized protein YabN with tetrapyrrole methylase and pyrophosphatase domain